MPLHAGDWVEVISKEAILRSLDANGRLDGLPFMPQMFDYCGRRFQVFKRAHKTCDTVHQTGGRSLPNGIHLADLRCNGGAYGGCQAACLLFWNEAWLMPVPSEAPASADAELETAPVSVAPSNGQGGCTEEAVWAGTLAAGPQVSGKPRYSCQATELPVYTTLLKWWDVRQYVEDFTSGNVGLLDLLKGGVYAVYYYLTRRSTGRAQKALQRLYDLAVPLWGGTPFPQRRGTLPSDRLMPPASLNLQPGELVRVKSYKEILSTLDRNNKNWGLYFDSEMVPFCGKTFRVKDRLTKFIREDNGEMIKLKTPALSLEKVWCQSCYSDRRMHCPRSIYSWWREAWLERVDEPPMASNKIAEASGKRRSHPTLGKVRELLLTRHAHAASFEDRK